jgi:hypothetical protein
LCCWLSDAETISKVVFILREENGAMHDLLFTMIFFHQNAPDKGSAKGIKIIIRIKQLENNF